MISVIIPAYNAQQFICETLDSVFAQTYCPLEVIVVDDGSTDRTGELVGSYRYRLPRKNRHRHEPDSVSRRTPLRYFYQDNAGPSKARNTGIELACGNLIAFLDADDLWQKDKLTKQICFLESDPETDLLFGDMTIFNAQGVLVPSVYEKSGYPLCDELWAVLKPFEMLLRSNKIYTGTVLVKKKCFERVGYFDESLRHGEDYDMWLRIANRYKLSCIPEVLMRRRMHGFNLGKDEECFFYSKLYILRKLYDQNHIRSVYGKLLHKTYLTTRKELSYFFYCKRKYPKALFALALFVLSYCRFNCLKSD